MNVTVPSHLEAPGPIIIQLAIDPTAPVPGADFFVSSSVNSSVPPSFIGSAGVNVKLQDGIRGNMTFNLPQLPEGLLMWRATSDGGGVVKNGSIIGTSNTFSVTPAPPPKNTAAVTATESTSKSVMPYILLSIGIILVVAIAGIFLICRRRSRSRGSARRSPASVEDGRAGGPGPSASDASLNSLPEKARDPWVEVRGTS
ncbi:hypothetical protein B0H17DRAFT_1142399 [Mycena rosella]|uniref:Uncharacterized protein n=1 Tax=Mycena rosella TaxID=1033263 RepID=A0AAD7G5K8_MYCRO|nr:hypothetical protein B0H17DRAFT_1142399 [Mycena rosella]